MANNKLTPEREAAIEILSNCAARYVEGPQGNIDRAITLAEKILLDRLRAQGEAPTADALKGLRELTNLWEVGIQKFLDGVKDSPSHDLKRMAKERAEAYTVCLRELRALLPALEAQLAEHDKEVAAVAKREERERCAKIADATIGHAGDAAKAIRALASPERGETGDALSQRKESC